jgi:tRNA dimethylallyltransferase
MTTLGYREMSAYLRGEMTLAVAVERIQVETHRFVRHQMTWFRKMQGIEWFDLSEPGSAEAVMQRVEQFLAGYYDKEAGSQ